MSKRFLSLLMSLVLCFSMLPSAALSENTDTAPTAVQEQQETYTLATGQEHQETEALPAVQSSEENDVAVQLSEYAAKIGAMQYSTLKDAFSAAEEQQSATVELLKNVELSGAEESLTVRSDVTLDTNGFAIQSEYANITVERNGKLTVESPRGTGGALNIPIFIENGAALEASADAGQLFSHISVSNNSTLICTVGTIGLLALTGNGTDYNVELADSDGHCAIRDGISAENSDVTVENLLKKHLNLALCAGDDRISRDWTIESLQDGFQDLWVGVCANIAARI